MPRHIMGGFNIQDGAADASVLQSLATPMWQAISSNLGNSTELSPGGVPERNIGGFLFPAIPAGVPTTVIPVVFLVTTAGPSAKTKVIEEGEVLAVFGLAILIWMIPSLLANTRFCCRCCQRCLSKRLGWYFCLGMIVNLSMLSMVIASEPEIKANDLFFQLVEVVEVVSDKLQEVLMQVGAIVGLFMLYSFRKRLIALLGFDSQLVKLELRDFLTCFSMTRFKTVEVSLLKASDLPCGYGSRALFVRVVMGCNEPLHSRPRDGCMTSLNLRERWQLNFDPEDVSQTLSIAIKEQEVVGAAVAQLAPAAGAIAGALAGLMTPAGPQGGAALGAIAGIGTANSLGPEVARLDMSAAFINSLREKTKQMQKEEPPPSMATGPSFAWREENFVKVDLVPQGYLWLRISDVQAA